MFPALKGVAVYDSPKRYRFFQSDQILNDSVLNIQLDLKKVFK